MSIAVQIYRYIYLLDRSPSSDSVKNPHSLYDFSLYYLKAQRPLQGLLSAPENVNPNDFLSIKIKNAAFKSCIFHHS